MEAREAHCNILVTIDNVKNQVNAVIEAGLGPQIGCFARHQFINPKGKQMDHLRGKIGKDGAQQQLMCLRPSKKCYSY